MIIRALAWVLATLLLLVMAPYALLVVGPFLRHGLFLNPETVYAGIYAPKSLSPYDWFNLEFRYTLIDLARLLHAFVASVLPLPAIILLLLLLVRPSAFSKRETLTFYFIGLAALLLFCAAWSLLIEVPTWLQT